MRKGIAQHSKSAWENQASGQSRPCGPNAKTTSASFKEMQIKTLQNTAISWSQERKPPDVQAVVRCHDRANVPPPGNHCTLTTRLAELCVREETYCDGAWGRKHIDHCAM
jgi:hypothetical protein